MGADVFQLAGEQTLDVRCGDGGLAELGHHLGAVGAGGDDFGAGSPPGGLVLDPFSGAVTTGLAAQALGRRYIGIDLNPAYHDIAIQRLDPP